MLLLIDGQWQDTGSFGTLIPYYPTNATPIAPAQPSVTLGAVMAEVLRSKASAQRRACYVKSLRHYLGRFAKGRESVPIASITTGDVENWLARYPDASSRQTHLNRINTLFSFAAKRELIAKNPCAKIERITVDHVTPRILTNEQAETLLRHVVDHKGSQLAALVLGLFAGMRPTEIQRSGWDAVNLDACTVTVSATASKVRRRRVVVLQPNAVAWLKLAKDRGALLPPSEMSARRFRRQWAKVLGFKGGWPPDLLRHTAASQLLALTGDAGKVATMLGNSISILHRHYFGVCQPSDAAGFWSIMP